MRQEGDMRMMTISVPALLLLAGCGEAIEAQESHAVSRDVPQDEIAADNSAPTADQPEIKLQDPVALD